jgi:hypothetical protein
MPRQVSLDTPGPLHDVIIRGIEKRRILDDRWGSRQFCFKYGTGGV